MPSRATALSRARTVAYPLLGLALSVLLWWILVHRVGRGSPMAARFAPERTWGAAADLLRAGDLWGNAWASLRRVGLGLACALFLGVPIGLLTGSWRGFDQSTSTLFQFLRMISPLSWMPVAVMALGVGEAPVIFLLAFAALWPIALNVSAGIAAIDPQWLTLADSLGASRRERLWHVVVPAIATHLLTGIRLAIGIIWVVLVPAEMLGVNAGLGYLILDTRDRMAYGELMATILFIGLLGFVLDWLARQAHHRWIGP
ncbi:MAG TPA: ABC transporter permease [Anaeromyxobacteraceae bacterium]